MSNIEFGKSENEKKLKKLFDFQKFAENKELQSLIDESKDRIQDEFELMDDDLEFAAGGVNKDIDKPEQK